jgi:AcrR family transcriptional regulator
MPRWEPDTLSRLRAAAIELFTEHGYEHVTAEAIAARAGVTRRTFFRYFSDKREVLFAGSERLPPAIAEAVREVEAGRPPMDAIRLGLLAIAGELSDGLDHTAARRAIIEANADLQERERTKQAAVTDALAAALESRGEPPHTAHLYAGVGSVILQSAFDQWVSTPRTRSLSTCIQSQWDHVAAGVAPSAP